MNEPTRPGPEEPLPLTPSDGGAGEAPAGETPRANDRPAAAAGSPDETQASPPAPGGEAPSGAGAGSRSTGPARALGKSRDFLLGALSSLGEWLRPLWIPLIPGLLGVAVSYVLWLAADERQYQVIVQVVEAQGGWLQTEMQRELDARERAIADLAQRVTAAPPRDARSWQEAARGLVAGGYQFRAIAWMDTARAPVYVAPPEERYLAAFDPTDDGGRQIAVNEALGALLPGHSTIVTSSVALSAGGREVLILAPVRGRGRSAGYVVGVLRVRDLLDVMLRRAFARGYTIAVYEGPLQLFGPVWMYGGPEVFYERYVDVGSGELAWQVQLWPSEEKARTLHSTAPTAILVLGLVASFLASVLVFVLRSGREARLL